MIFRNVIFCAGFFTSVWTLFLSEFSSVLPTWGNCLKGYEISEIYIRRMDRIIDSCVIEKKKILKTNKLDVRSNFNNCMNEFHTNYEPAFTKEILDKMDPCLLACILKANKIFNNKGMFDPKEAKKLTANLEKNETMKKKFTNVRNICISVNKKTVTDGKRGCDRAKLLYNCFEEAFNIS